MLSNPLQRFSPYQSMPQSGMLPNGHVQQSAVHHNGLNVLGQASQYGLHQQLHHHVPIHSPQLARAGSQPKQRQQPYGPGARAAANGQVRRRISRACDQCNQLRTKCDGHHPCAHCIGESKQSTFDTDDTNALLEFGLGCEYARERKKRGKASRKDLAAQAAAQAAVASGQKSDTSGAESTRTQDKQTPEAAPKLPQHNGQDQRSSPVDTSSSHTTGATHHQTSVAEGIEDMDDMAGQTHLVTHPGDHLGASPPSMDLNGFGNVQHSYDRQDLSGQMMGGQAFGSSQSNLSGYPDLSYSMQAPSPNGYHANAGFRMGNSPMTGYPLGPGPTSPGWGVPMQSPPGQYQAHVAQPSFNQAGLRYPVLEPLIPHLANILPLTLACDLIDLYFSSSSSAQMHPISPYVLGVVFRKRSFLHPTKPRRCQPALLASMLWVAAQTSDSSFLTSVPSARGKICQKLLELTVGLLNPLIHTPSGAPSPGASPAADGVALGGLGVALPGTISMDALTGESGAFGAAGNVDDVITYIHLATVVSASEYKGASLRWWNAAWSLARELKLGRELPPSAAPAEDGSEMDADDLDQHDIYRNSPNFVTEEEREERRRIWWLVYIVDRHLALCYNRPLFLLDIECDGLRQPLDDTAWQRGDFGDYTNGNTDPSILNSMSDEAASSSNIVRGPNFECRGHSIFGYFLPLMTILGEIVDLHHARNHPRFGVGFRSAREWDEQAAEITRHLELYEQSLQLFEKKNMPKHPDDRNEANIHENGDLEAGTPSVHSVHTNSSCRLTESDIQARIVIAYGTHVMHVLHILLAGKWDPINLLDDNDLWISSQGFITATSHAVSAAEAINQILEFDPGLEFMPFFFGIYLLQGSFLLLLITDKLQVEASPSVVRACETIVRAHEACVVTLSTEYQVSFLIILFIAFYRS
jgi:xylanolytic transcriptional activator XlnR